MKFVIWKQNGAWYSTEEWNYHAFVRDARKVQRWDGFETAEEIMDYWHKYFDKEGKDTFEVIGN